MIKSTVLKRSLVAITIGFGLYAAAIPAFPGKESIVQPDGTKLTVSLLGDEFSHITVTDDEFTVIETPSGEWQYAIRATDGSLSPSGIAAHNPSDRNDRETSFLNNTSRKITPAITRRRHPRRQLNRGLLNRGLLNGNKNASTGTSAPGFIGYPLNGQVRSLVLLIEFPDIEFVTPDVHQEISDMLNLPGFDRREHIGCAADYFRTQSMGQFNPTFDVYGPVKASKPATYYGENDDNGDDKFVWELILEACRKLDEEINFADYDLDGDGRVDNVYIFYAGYGENFAGNKASWIWPHAYYMHAFPIDENLRTFDGKLIDSYGCCAELYGSTGTDTGAMGTFCHEFGHILGLPDTYDVNYATDGTGNHPDQWDIMASGSYLPATRNCGAVPAGYSGVERWLLGWGDPIDISKPQTVNLPDLQQSNQFLRISTSDPNEFYILENRQKNSGSYDRYIPSHGMLIWHIDRRENAHITVTIEDEQQTISCMEAWDLDFNAVNSLSTHQCLEIEKASGNSGSKSTEDTPFPGRQEIRSFTDDTTPSMKTWAGNAVGKPITNIRELNGMISFDFCGGGEQVKVVLNEPTGITDTGFTANWEQAGDADDYRLYLWSVERHDENGATTLDQTFASLPEGWTAEGTTAFENGAIVLSGTKAATLESPEMNINKGGTLTIRARQYATDAGMLSVSYAGQLVSEYVPTNSFSNFNIEIPAGLGEGKITIATQRRKQIILDRLTLVQDREIIDYKPIEGYPTQTGNTTTLNISNLTPMTEYAYAVEALGFAGSLSERSFLTTSNLSDIQTADMTCNGKASVKVVGDTIICSGFTGDPKITIRDISGRTVSASLSELPTGFYILTAEDNAAGASTKFIIR